MRQPLTQNKHILDGLAVAVDAAKDLTNKGYNVLNVGVSNRNPRIEIQSCLRCGNLNGTPRIHRNTSEGRMRLMTVLHKGAQVEWEERA